MVTERLQGSICLTLGLLSLGGLLLFEPMSVANQNAKPRSEHVRLPGALFRAGADATRDWVAETGGVTLRRYRGRYHEQRTIGETEWAWQVDVFCWLTSLAKYDGSTDDGASTRQVLIVSRSQPIRGWAWFEDPPTERSETIVGQLDPSGRLVKRIASWQQQKSLVPLEALLRQPASTEGHSSFLDHNVRVTFDRANDHVTHLVTSGRRIDKGTELRYRGAIALCEDSQLSREDTAAFQVDWQAWQQAVVQARSLTLAASHVAGSAQEAQAAFHRQYARFERFAEAAFVEIDDNSPLSIAVKDLLQQGVVGYRTQAGVAQLQQLVQRGPISWSGDELGGQRRTREDFRGRLTLLGFVALGPEGAAEALQTMVKLRQQFSEQDVSIVAMSTDYDRQDSQQIAQLLAGSVPVLRASQAASDFGVTNTGLPSFVILDEAGNVCHLHAWQPFSESQWLAKQMNALLDTASVTRPPGPPGASSVSSVRASLLSLFRTPLIPSDSVPRPPGLSPDPPESEWIARRRTGSPSYEVNGR